MLDRLPAHFPHVQSRAQLHPASVAQVCNDELALIALLLPSALAAGRGGGPAANAKRRRPSRSTPRRRARKSPTRASCTASREGRLLPRLRAAATPRASRVRAASSFRLVRVPPTPSPRPAARAGATTRAARRRTTRRAPSDSSYARGQPTTSRRGSHRGMDGSHAEDEGRFEMGARLPARDTRRPRHGLRHPREQRAGLHDGDVGLPGGHRPRGGARPRGASRPWRGCEAEEGARRPGPRGTVVIRRGLRAAA